MVHSAATAANHKAAAATLSLAAAAPSSDADTVLAVIKSVAATSHTTIMI